MHSNPDYLVKQKSIEKGRRKGSKDYFDVSETLLHVDKLCVEFPSYYTSTVACNQLTFEVKTDIGFISTPVTLFKILSKILQSIRKT